MFVFLFVCLCVCRASLQPLNTSTMVSMSRLTSVYGALCGAGCLARIQGFRKVSGVSVISTALGVSRVSMASCIAQSARASRMSGVSDVVEVARVPFLFVLTCLGWLGLFEMSGAFVVHWAHLGI